MKLKRYKLWGIFLLPVLAAPAYATDASSLFDGTWVSLSCELRPQQGQDGIAPWYLKREVTFTENRIDAHFQTFADAECSTPLLDLKFGGDVVVKGESNITKNAKNVDLIVNDYLSVVPKAEQMISYLNSAAKGDCGTQNWRKGVEQNVFNTGCTLLGVAANTPSNEYEVLYVEAGHLYFGARPITGKSLDNPAERPTALQVPLVLSKGGKTRKVGIDDVRVPKVVEIVLFEQHENANASDVKQFFENITVKMNSNDTLLYRTVAQGENGQWLCINYWSSRDAMNTLNAQAQAWTDEFADMAKLAKPDSFQLTSYNLQN